MNVSDKVRETITRRCMIQKGDTVTAGLSGGADSVCLVTVLHGLSHEMGFTLRAVHVNHCLRGEESDRDQHFCEELCKRLDIPLEVCRVDVTGFARESGRSTEEAARILRYGAFDKVSCGGKTATAHNKNDNAETVLFNIVRGTGLKGLGGIPYVRGNIIRPLLDVSRSEIEEYLAQMGQGFVTDSTNLTEDYSRNKLRRRIIPQLEEINADVTDALCRLSLSAEEDEIFLSQLTDDIDPQRLCGYAPSLRKRYIRRLLSENNIPVSRDRIEEIDAAVISGRKTRFDLSRDIFAVTDGKSVVIRKMSRAENFRTNVVFSSDKEIIVPEYDKKVIIERPSNDIFQKQGIVKEKLTNGLVNYDKIQGVVILRNKQDGDSIRLARRDHTTKLKKLYNSLKLTDEERQSALVMEDDEGIFWSEYGGASDRVSPDKNETSENLYIISVRRKINDN